MNEYLEALTELNQAKQNFDNANPEYIDAALYQLKAAEEKLSSILKEEKRRKANVKAGSKIQKQSQKRSRRNEKRNTINYQEVIQGGKKAW